MSAKTELVTCLTCNQTFDPSDSDALAFAMYCSHACQRQAPVPSSLLVQTVWLCQSENGYVHCVFDSMRAASQWCSRYPQYHVIQRRMYAHPSQVR